MKVIGAVPGLQRTTTLLLFSVAIAGIQLASATTITSSVFATGAAVSSTGPDSITYGAGSIWVEYSNGAKSDGSGGSSTVVRYAPNGSVQNTYTIPGSVDGLKYNPNTGTIWALQNQDANSTLTVINPATNGTTSYAYGPIYSSMSATRGIDDVVFMGNNTFLSVTNPGPADPVVVSLTGGLFSPLTTSSVVTATGLPLTDPDSLKSTTSGGLILTGEADKTLFFITAPGTAGQTVTSLPLTAAPGTTIGNPDDALYPTATSGTFYLTDSSTNTVYALAASGLSTSQLYVNVGNEFGTVDASGVVTPIFTGTGLHGIEFVPASASAVPEPSTFGLLFAGFVCTLCGVRKKSR